MGTPNSAVVQNPIKVKKLEKLDFVQQRLYIAMNSTLSLLSVNGWPLCFVIEDKPAYDRNKDGKVTANDKVMSETAIEAGNGVLAPIRFGRFFTSYNHDYGHLFAIAIMTMPGIDSWGKTIQHKNIRFHMGRHVAHTAGCPLAGLEPILSDELGFVFPRGKSGEAYLQRVYPLLLRVYDKEKNVFTVPVTWTVKDIKEA